MNTNKFSKLIAILLIVHASQALAQNDSIIGPYGEKTAKNACLGAVSIVKGTDLEKYLSTDILTGLQGRMPGFNVSQYRGFFLPHTNNNVQSALIGSIPSEFGHGSYSDNTRFNLKARGNAPVVIFDGIERDIFDIDPEAIESVSLQQDALSSQFLGMRSSRGALIITTKNPVKGKMRFSLTGKLGVHSSVRSLKPLSSAQYAYLLNEAMQNDGKSAIYNHNDFQAYLNGSSPYTHPDINWEDALMRDNAITQSYNLNVSGGGNVAQYFVSIGYMNEEGLFRQSSANDYNTNLTYNRYSISSKVNINVLEGLTASLTAYGRVIEGNQPGGSGTGYSDLLNSIFTTPNNAYPIRNENGTFGGSYAFPNNLYSQTMESGYISDNTRDIMASAKVRYEFGEGLKGFALQFLGSVANQTRTTITRVKRNPVYELNYDDNGKPFYNMYGSPQSQSNDFSAVANYQNLYGQLSIEYGKEIGLHSFMGKVVGDTREEINDYDLPLVPSNIRESIMYNYDKKYYVEGVMTQSYFNRYAKGNRWGNFYAIGLGWDISKENFLSSVSWLNQLKIRGVYGLTGNGIDNSGYFIYRQAFENSMVSFYPLGTDFTNGYLTYETTPLANPYITYEKAHKLNVGIDFAAFSNRLQATLNYYNDKYFDLLQERGKSIEIIGSTYPTENIGKSRRTGVDVSLSWQDKIGGLGYFVTGNWSIAKTKLLFMDEQETPYNYLRRTGRPEGVIFGLQAIGFLSAEDIAAGYPKMDGYDVQPGDVKYADLNSDGVINEWDRTVIGGDQPEHIFGFEYGIEYKGIEFSMLWQGVTGRDLYVNNRTLVEGFQPIGNSYGQAYQNLLARWTPETAETATYPRLTVGGNTYNYGGFYNSSLWVEDGSFMRLKNLYLAYTLPSDFCKSKLGGIHPKIFIEAQNLLTFAKTSIVDPEVTFTSSPLQRTIAFGINIKY
ncbi:MAG: SusC/RagA family TonB-linked outer membrane protein [Prevotella sp.]|nr:SusC/RagA family TonB-linked outer membrane protein [Prevotella sp.]